MSEPGEIVAQERLQRIPLRWQKVAKDFDQVVSSGKLDEFTGTTDQSTHVRLYHGTVRQKLPSIIRDGGMKPFFEKAGEQPAIFLTASPTNAIRHAIENGPHDTLRKVGLVSGALIEGDEVLLLVEVPKEWLLKQPEATHERNSEVPEWLRENTDAPRTVTNIEIFNDGIQRDVEQIKAGLDADSFGIKFPTSFLPVEYISELSPDGTTKKIGVTTL